MTQLRVEPRRFRAEISVLRPNREGNGTPKNTLFLGQYVMEGSSITVFSSRVHLNMRLSVSTFRLERFGGLLRAFSGNAQSDVNNSQY